MANIVDAAFKIVFLLFFLLIFFELALLLLIGLSQASSKTLRTIGAITVFGIITALAALFSFLR